MKKCLFTIAILLQIGATASAQSNPTYPNTQDWVIEKIYAWESAVCKDDECRSDFQALLKLQNKARAATGHNEMVKSACAAHAKLAQLHMKYGDGPEGTPRAELCGGDKSTKLV